MFIFIDTIGTFLEASAELSKKKFSFPDFCKETYQLFDQFIKKAVAKLEETRNTYFQNIVRAGEEAVEECNHLFKGLRVGKLNFTYTKNSKSRGRG